MSSSEQVRRDNMFQSTSSSGYSNGYHHDGVSGGGAHSAENRLRRGSRSRSRNHGSGSDLRVSTRMIQQQREEKTGTDKAPAPCTDFDVAYFNSYAHLSIHEEMIKG